MLHVPVMTAEVTSMLMPALRPGSRLLDMTFGTGGHLRALLERVSGLCVYALDRDPDAYQRAVKMAADFSSQARIIPLLGKFSDTLSLLRKHGGTDGAVEGTFDGVLIDCGCCSTQMDDHRRGFSISGDGPLDMRMDADRCPQTATAFQVLQHCSEKNLTRIFRVYGDEKRAASIANAIVEARYLQCTPQTTGQLASLVEGVCNRISRDKLGRPAHTATKVFQALRIFVNDELNELRAALMAARRLLRPSSGRLAVISFHSLEDRIVKEELLSTAVNELPACVSPTAALAAASAVSTTHLLMTQTVPVNGRTGSDVTIEKRWKQLHKKVMVPSEDEVMSNTRARSAKLRVAQRLTAS